MFGHAITQPTTVPHTWAIGYVTVRTNLVLSKGRISTYRIFAITRECEGRNKQNMRRIPLDGTDVLFTSVMVGIRGVFF